MFKIDNLIVITLITMVFSTFSFAEENSAVALAYKHDSSELQWGPCPAFLGKECKIAVLQGDPAKKNTDVFFKVPAEYDIPYHWHTSAERMVLVSGTMTVKYDNQNEEVLTTGTYAYGPSKHPHRAYCEKGESCVLFIAFEEPIDAFEIMKSTQD
ncbi:cupin domain-containing protein [Sulfurimonas marina]|uniref:Cupin domain-containing protein n=1 Tax=Sulfurimonas marina TaxID=2590551 RepID=A0A7M1AWJ2_9BACT|nr:cupin domain-containing protein [Sulfurimonas marina]QOP41804.1 cupin domain-containing protein [Sulfurimonas marina]